MSNAPAIANTNDAPEPLYYSKDGRVYCRPVTTVKEDGTTAITLGFAVCLMVEGMDAQAHALAELMNVGEAVPEFVAAIQAIETTRIDSEDAETGEPLISIPVATYAKLQAALKKVARR